MTYTEPQRKALAKQGKAAGIPDALNVFKTRSLEAINASTAAAARMVVEARERVITNPRDVPRPPKEPMDEETKELLRRKAEVERSFKPKKPPKPKREDAYKGDEVIRILKPNPCRPGTAAHAVFEQYSDGMTVGDFMFRALHACPGKLRPVDYVIYDARKGRIAIEPPGTVVKPRKPEAKPAKAKPEPKSKAKAAREGAGGKSKSKPKRKEKK